MRGLKALYSKLRSFRQDSSGSAAVEFVLIAPIYFALMFSTFEAGWIMTKSMMLERGVDLTMRDLRLGKYLNPTHDQMKTIICGHTAMLKNCEDTMLLELVQINDASDFPTNTQCVERKASGDIIPTVTFDPTRGNREVETMFVRACVRIDPLAPGIGLALHLPKDDKGGVAMVSYGAFVNEPTSVVTMSP